MRLWVGLPPGGLSAARLAPSKSNVRPWAAGAAVAGDSLPPTPLYNSVVLELLGARQLHLRIVHDAVEEAGDPLRHAMASPAPELAGPTPRLLVSAVCQSLPCPALSALPCLALPCPACCTTQPLYPVRCFPPDCPLPCPAAQVLLRQWLRCRSFGALGADAPDAEALDLLMVSSGEAKPRGRPASQPACLEHCLQC